MKLVVTSAVVIGLAALLLSGCSSIAKPTPVYVPVKCKVEIPKLKEFSGFIEEDTRSLVINQKELFCNLSFCVNGDWPAECIDKD